MEQPDLTVDVVMPVYNGERYIRQALASVAGQSRLPDRIIVVDDGSTDGTAAIVKSFPTPVPLCYVHQPNSGVSTARNAGIARSSADYVAFLDADDEWHPEKLARQLRAFRDSDVDDLAAVYCHFSIMDDSGDPCGEDEAAAPDTGMRGSIFDRLLVANMIAGSGSGVMVKRDVLARVGEFDQVLRAFEDWDMWLRIARQYRFDYVAEKLVRIRRHGANLQKDKVLMFENALAFYNKWSEAACRYGHHGAWGDSIAWRIACDLPDPGTFLIARRGLTRETRRRLFPCGSIVLGMLRNTRSILILFAQRLLGRSDAA